MTRVFPLLGFALVFILVEVRAGQVPAAFQTIAAAVRHSCIEKTGATVAQIENASDGKFDDDPKLKCYLLCILEKFNVFRDGKIDFDLMELLIPPEMTESGKKMINGCRTTTGADPCDTVFQTSKCFFEQVPEDFFVI